MSAVKPSVQFTEMLRLAQALELVQQEAAFNYFCPLCNDERPFIFVADVGRQEVYQCGCCAYQKAFTVR